MKELFKKINALTQKLQLVTLLGANIFLLFLITYTIAEWYSVYLWHQNLPVYEVVEPLPKNTMNNITNTTFEATEEELQRNLTSLDKLRLEQLESTDTKSDIALGKENHEAVLSSLEKLILESNQNEPPLE